MEMSPGRFPKGKKPRNCPNKPRAKNTIPRTIKSLLISNSISYVIGLKERLA
jgi:hypothetical protein